MINNLKLGHFYSKIDLSEILNEKNIRISREGLYYCKKEKRTLLFVDLVKKGKEDRFHFNDYFQGDFFHWDSQTTQHQNSPKLLEIINKEVEVLLFTRIYPKVKSKTQPFVYCGKLEYLEHDLNTNKPVHLIYESFDYNDNTSSKPLLDIYNWSPKDSGKSTTNKKDYSGVVSKKRKQNYSKPNETERIGLVTTRVGQGWYRQEILKKWDNKCGVTGSGLKEILISSHIVPWRDSNQDEKLDSDNGILLSPNLDGLFDRYLITFKDSGRIIISNRINTNDLNRLGINQNMKLTQITDGMKPYLSRHRKIFNDKN